jgi:pyridoxal phosphate enzyme (YggS family)
VTEVADRLIRLREHIGAAAARSGRDPAGIRIIGVAKGQPFERVKAAVDAGLTELGENYLQEAETRMSALAGRAVRWHFVGALQSNKTRQVAECFDWVHSVDRVRIARRLAGQRRAHASPLAVCIQVRLGNEPGKAGVDPAGLTELAGQVAALSSLSLRGLMAIPPPELEFERQRGWFRRLRELRDGLMAEGLELDTLSMGMSADLEAAVVEGTTMLRIGSALFGARE